MITPFVIVYTLTLFIVILTGSILFDD